MKHCCVQNCNSIQSPASNVHFFQIPSFPAELRQKWIETIPMTQNTLDPNWNPVVCHKHFKPEDFSKSTLKRIRLLPQSFPTIFPVSSIRENEDSDMFPISSFTENEEPIVFPICSLKELDKLKIKTESDPYESTNESAHSTFMSDSENETKLTHSPTIARISRFSNPDSYFHSSLPSNNSLSKVRSLRKQNFKLERQVELLKKRNSSLSKQIKIMNIQQRQLSRIWKHCSENNISALMLMEQINNYGEKVNSFSDDTLKVFSHWQRHYPDSYDFVQCFKLFKLPKKCTLDNYLRIPVKMKQ